jgi:hypothetical protein
VRATTSVALVAITLAIFIASVVWAWATPDFWESAPLIPCVLSAAFFGACATYALRRGLPAAIVMGLVIAVITFITTLSVTSARWAS